MNPDLGHSVVKFPMYLNSKICKLFRCPLKNPITLNETRQMWKTYLTISVSEWWVLKTGCWRKVVAAKNYKTGNGPFVNDVTQIVTTPPLSHRNSCFTYNFMISITKLDPLHKCMTSLWIKNFKIAVKIWEDKKDFMDCL